MKVFAIKESKKELGYLFYFEREKEFVIELLDGLDEWTIPILFASLYKKGTRTINPYWSKVWVQQRIIPSDRQNIGQILRDNRLKEYDEYALLLLWKGKCEQDAYYLHQVDPNELPDEIKTRREHLIVNIQLLDGKEVLLFFKNGILKKYKFDNFFKTHIEFASLNDNYELFKSMAIMPGGYGLLWSNNLCISNTELYANGEYGPLCVTDLNNYAKENILTTAEVKSLLNCSRQYVSELVKKGILEPVNKTAQTPLFLKQDVLSIMDKY